MLRELIDAWRCDRCEELCKAIDEFAEMIADVDFELGKAWDVFSGKNSINDNRETILSRDVAINKHERSIRRRLVEHLAINPRHDAPGCLALMSIVKDAERMGDYAKNILDMAVRLEGEQKSYKYFDRLSSIHARISAGLPKLQKAYVKSDGAMAAEILSDYGPIKNDCKELMTTILDDSLPGREAAATALVTKYLGRIGSHLGNIASGIIYPLDKIDFVGSDAEE